MNFYIGEYVHMLAGGHIQVLQTSPYVALYLAIICILDNILYNKLVNVSKCFSEFCELLLQISCPQKGIIGISDL